MSDENNPYGSGTTGHVWDDTLAEATNQPPKWWMMGLHASWILVLLYTIVYPSWPWFGGAFQGVMGWSSIGEYKENLAALNEIRGKYEDQLPDKSAAAILADDELSDYVQRSAKVLFGDNCAACHGSGGAGNPGYPVLADDEWLYGGKIENIMDSITAGRQGVMPAKGGASLTEAEVDELARAVADTDPTSSPLFTGKGTCFACHGQKGKGNPAMGAPDLTDQIWRFGNGDVEDIKFTINHGVNYPGDPQSRNAEMPSWKDRLTETEIKKLAVYVHQFGGGQ